MQHNASATCTKRYSVTITARSTQQTKINTQFYKNYDAAVTKIYNGRMFHRRSAHCFCEQLSTVGRDVMYKFGEHFFKYLFDNIY